MQALRTLIEAPELHAGPLAGPRRARRGRARGRGRRGRRPRIAGRRPGSSARSLVAATVAGVAGIGPLRRRCGRFRRGSCSRSSPCGLAGEIGARTGVAGRRRSLALAGGVALVDPAADFPAWVAVILVLGPAVAGTDRGRPRPAGPAPGRRAAAAARVDRRPLHDASPTPSSCSCCSARRSRSPCSRGRGRGPGSAPAARTRRSGLFLWIATLEGARSPGVDRRRGRDARAARRRADRPATRAAARRSSGSPSPPAPTPTATVAHRSARSWSRRSCSPRTRLGSRGSSTSALLALVLALPALVVGVAVGARWQRRRGCSRPRGRSRRHRRDGPRNGTGPRRSRRRAPAVRRPVDELTHPSTARSGIAPVRPAAAGRAASAITEATRSTSASSRSR